jgi:hypothetical protein
MPWLVPPAPTARPAAAAALAAAKLASSRNLGVTLPLLVSSASTTRSSPQLPLIERAFSVACDELNGHHWWWVGVVVAVGVGMCAAMSLEAGAASVGSVVPAHPLVPRDSLKLAQRSFDHRFQVRDECAADRLVMPQLLQRRRCSAVENPEHGRVLPGTASHERRIPPSENAKRPGSLKPVLAVREIEDG